MTTIDEVARAAISGIATNAGLFHAIRWASERYRQLTSRVKMRHLRKIGEIVIPAPVDDGTVTITRGSDVVVGDATARTAWAAVDQIGDGTWYIRVRRVWYVVVGLDPSTGDLKLQSIVAEDDTSDTTYKLVKRYHPLAQEARQLGKFVHMRLQKPLRDESVLQMDMEHPARWITAGSGPEVVCQGGNSPDGRRLVEFYPFSTKEEIIHYVYWPVPPSMRSGAILPAEIDLEALKSGVLVDLYRWEMSRAMREGKVDQANSWGNEARRQETTWNDRIEEMANADRGKDDVTFILHTRGMPLAGDVIPPIRSAREDAWSRLDNWP